MSTTSLCHNDDETCWAFLPGEYSIVASTPRFNDAPNVWRLDYPDIAAELRPRDRIVVRALLAYVLDQIDAADAKEADR